MATALALFFSFSTAAQAFLTAEQKCYMKTDLLKGKFSLCLSKADAKVDIATHPMERRRARGWRFEGTRLSLYAGFTR